jgi:hypothetical protein
MKVIRRCIAVGMMVTVVTGCGSITREVVLRSNGTGGAGSMAQDSAKAIYFSGLEDKRIDREVGWEQDLKDNNTAKVVAINDVGKWVNREIVFQLKEKGFLFLPLDAPQEKRRVSISGDILRVREVVRGEYSAEVSFKVKITVDGKVVSEKKYRSAMKGIMEDVSSADAFEKTLRSALAMAVSQLVDDVEVNWSSVSGDAPAEIAESAARVMAQAQTQAGNSESLFEEELCPREGNKVEILQGNRPKLGIKARLDSIRTGIQWFHRERQRENTALAQSACFGIVIEKDGNVSEVKEITSWGDSEFSQKVMKEIRTVRFSRRSSDSTATYAVYSLSFGRQTAQQSDSQSAAIALRAISIVLPLLMSFILIPAITHQ